MSKVEGLDTDGKVVLKVDPKHIELNPDGTLKINHPKLQDFLRSHKKGTDAHLILMGSNCGCQCCC